MAGAKAVADGTEFQSTEATAGNAPGNGNASNAKPDQGGAAANANTPATAQQWQNYLRAESACLEARGYTVD
jgi:hypothetical protein